jgi:hypothetical protein
LLRDFEAKHPRFSIITGASKDALTAARHHAQNGGFQ